MKFICETAPLSIACQNVQRATSAKSSLPSAEGIFINATDNGLILTGYDLEIGISTSVFAKIEETGSVVLNARILCEILRKLPGETVTIECDSRNLAIIRSGEIKYEIMGFSGDDYPELPVVQDSFSIEIAADVFNSMIKQTIFSVSVPVPTSSQKIIYTGIKVEIGNNEIRLIAIDGFRMAIRKETINYDGKDISFIVPGKTMSEIMRLAGESDSENNIISICTGVHHIVFNINGYYVISRLLEGDFLNYRATIPSSSTMTVSIDTRKFIDSIERTALIITDKTQSLIRCVFDTGFVRISSSTNLGIADDKLAAEIDGERTEIGFNNRYLLDALKACETDRVIIKLNGSASPILITPVDGDSFNFLVLPVRLKNNG